jgi:CheY-like chemotaxis protein
VALEAQGYRVAQAGDAEHGLDALRGGRFDMVLSDYDLPGKTGAAMLREAHQGGLLDGASTLIVTAHPDPDGVDDVTLVRKPLDLEKFLLQVRGILDSRPERPSTDAAAPANSPDAAEQAGEVELTLYVSSFSPPSLKARRNMERLLKDFPDHIAFDICDLAENAQRAEKDNVVFTPTLVKRRPEPRAWILGDLSDPAVVTDLLHMCGIDPTS